MLKSGEFLSNINSVECRARIGHHPSLMWSKDLFILRAQLGESHERLAVMRESRNKSLDIWLVKVGNRLDSNSTFPRRSLRTQLLRMENVGSNIVEQIGTITVDKVGILIDIDEEVNNY